MTPVLIAGAGPTGLTLACELAVRGVPHRLVDAADGPFPGSRAKGVQPRTLEVFDRLGIAAEVVGAGLLELPFRQYGADGSVVDVPRPGLPASPDVPWPTPVLIPQWRTEQALRARLQALGGRIEYGTTLEDAEAGADRVHATLRSAAGTEAVDAAWLVGCDGGRSRVRHAAAFQFLGETHDDMRMLVGDMRVPGLSRTHWHFWRPANGFLAMAPLAGSDAFQVQVAIGPSTPDATTLENFQRLVDHYTGRTDLRLADPAWTSLWRANVRMVDRYRIGRVLLAGDAAHVHTPAGGQGMNTGIQDAFNLGWKLAAVAGGAPESLLDTYEAERLPVARHVLGLSMRLAAATVSQGPQGLVKRDEDTFQLGIHYRESPLSRERRAAPGRVRAGDRAPDATALRDAGGRACRLFDAFRGPAATLLAFGDGVAPLLRTLAAAAGDAVRAVCIVERAAGDAAVTMLADTEGHARAAWQPGAAALFIVRPDGVVGFASDTPDVDEALAWLRLAGLVR